MAKQPGVKNSSTDPDDGSSLFYDLAEGSPWFTDHGAGIALPGDLADASPWHNVLLLQNLQQLATWQMTGTAVTGGGDLSPLLGNGWAVIGTGDFEGTGSKDILLRNGNGGQQLAVWQTSGQSVVGGGLLSSSLQPGWSVVGVGDLNGDKRSDLVLQNGQQLAVWFMNGQTMTGGGNINTLGAGWSVGGVGDFNGDGRDDLLLQHGVPTVPERFQVQLAEWLMDGQTVIAGSGVIGNMGENWYVAGIGDFNKDNRSDLLLENGPDLAEWQMNGTTLIGGGNIGQLNFSNKPWIVNGVGDYNNDGYSDILLQHSGDNQLAQWQLNGTTVLPTSGNVTPALSPGYTLAMPPPVIPFQFVNTTGGAYRDDQIYITIIGAFPVTSGRTFINQDGLTVGRGAWVDSTGQAREPSAADANAPNHLTKDGKNYGNYSFTLQQASQLNIPALIGIRVYVSLGVPLYVTPDAHSIIGTPDAANPNNNPNYLTHFDHYEETFDPTTYTFYGANVTMIDQFGFPLTHRLEQTRINYDTTRGITNTATTSLAAMTDAYKAQTPAAFHDLIKYEADNTTVLRIIPPRRDLLPAAMQHYLDPAVDAFWSKYANQDFSVQYDLSHSVSGRVHGGQFDYQTITNNGAPKLFTMTKPSSVDIFANDGVFTTGVTDGDQGAFLAQLAAAFNRGVADSPSDWTNPSAFYKSALGAQPFNNYAAFFHQASFDSKAYAFAFDDTQSQSSVTILNNTFSPTKVTLDIGH